MKERINKTIITKKGGTIIIPNKIIKDEYPESSGNPGKNVIRTVPQNLTEEEKNQSRINQGLYAVKITPGGTIEYNGDRTDKEIIDYGGGMLFVKVADSPKFLTNEVLDSVVLFDNGEEREITDLSVETPGIPNFLFISTSGEPLIILADNFESDFFNLNGVYFLQAENNGEVVKYVKSLTYLEHEEIINKIDEKFLNIDKLRFENVENKAAYIGAYNSEESYEKYVSVEAIYSEISKRACSFSNTISIMGADVVCNTPRIIRPLNFNLSGQINLRVNSCYFTSKTVAKYFEWKVFIDNTNGYTFTITQFEFASWKDNIDSSIIDHFNIGTSSNDNPKPGFVGWTGDVVPTISGELQDAVYRLEFAANKKYMMTIYFAYDCFWGECKEFD